MQGRDAGDGGCPVGASDAAAIERAQSGAERGRAGAALQIPRLSRKGDEKKANDNDRTIIFAIHLSMTIHDVSPHFSIFRNINLLFFDGLRRSKSNVGLCLMHWNRGWRAALKP